MYILIKASMLMGIFSTKQKMRKVIEANIQDNYETKGCHGDYHFRYIKCNLNEPWFSKDGKYNSEVGQALFGLSTMHDEYFTHKVETDWSTGKILKL